MRAGAERNAAAKRVSRADAQTRGAAMSMVARDVPATDDAITVSDLPVARDAALAPAPWIERIRQRRDAGDAAGAGESLDLLLQAHPLLALPDDLRELAEGTAAANEP